MWSKWKSRRNLRQVTNTLDIAKEKKQENMPNAGMWLWKGKDTIQPQPSSGLPLTIHSFGAKTNKNKETKNQLKSLYKCN